MTSKNGFGARGHGTMSLRSGLAMVLAFAGATLASSTASAQSKTFYLDRLYWSGGPEDGIALHRPVVSETPRFFGQLGLGLSINPLRIENNIQDGDDAAALDRVSGNPVTRQLISYVDVGFEMLGRVAFQLELPFILNQAGNATSNGSIGTSSVDLQSAGVMDTRLDARFIVYRSDDRATRLAGVGSIWFPSGAEGSFGGDRGTSGALGLAGESSAGDFLLVLNTAVQWRPIGSLNDLSVQHEWRWGFGMFVPMRDGAMRLGGEIFGSTGLSSGTTFSAANTPLEWMFEGRFALDEEKTTYFGVGGGTRLSSGYAPDARVVALIGTSLPIEDSEPQAPPRKLRIPSGPQLPPDADKDGFPDDVDLCPSDPEDHKPPNSDDGCPAPPDRDADGILDANDKCPDQAEDFDKIDDKDGCPEEDADGDAVLDAIDSCPKEPGEPSAEPEKNGCPQFIRRIEGSNEIQILQQIQFQTAKAAILPQSFGILDEVVKLMKVNSDIPFIAIEGHTDDRGPKALNEKLSSDRANAVMEYLIAHGIDPERLSAQGFGPNRPIADNKTAEGRQKNRRVEFHIRDAGGSPAQTPPETPEPEPSP